MSELPSNAKLQRRIVLRLANRHVNTLSSLAPELGVQRESISRAMKALESNGYVARTRDGWALTDIGEDEAARLRAQLPEQAERAKASISRTSANQLKAIQSLGSATPILKSTERTLKMINNIVGSSSFRWAQEAGERIGRTFDASVFQTAFATPITPPVSTAIEEMQRRAAEATGAFTAAGIMANIPTFEAVNEILSRRSFEFSQELATSRPTPDLGKEFADSIRRLSETLPPVDINVITRFLDAQQTTLAATFDMSAQFKELTEGIGASHIAEAARVMTDLGSTITQMLGSLPHMDFASLIGPVNWSWISDAIQRRRVVDAFGFAGFIPSRSMDQAFIDKIVEVYEAGATQTELEGLILTFVDADGCAVLDALVNRLCEHPDFQDRVPVLRESIAAHKEGKDAISAYALVAMVEGLMFPLLRELTGKVDKLRYKEVAVLLGQLPVWLADLVGATAYSCLIAFIRNHLYQFSDWESDPTVRENYAELNRHRLLHGMAARGTRANTVRAFLVLDVIAGLMTAARNHTTVDDQDEGDDETTS
jgi:DNA-binding MarR family transcriptional regulator